MKARTVRIEDSVGLVLCSTVYEPGNEPSSERKKVLAKGHTINPGDLDTLSNVGHSEVSVVELETGEVGEAFAAMQTARAAACGELEIVSAADGRANLFSTQPCCVLVNDDLLKQVNTGCIVNVATLRHFTYARAGKRVATIKGSPFAVSSSALDDILAVIDKDGPILQARPIINPVIAVLYSDPSSSSRAKRMFESIMHQRLERMEARVHFQLEVMEKEREVAKALQRLLVVKPTCILIASATAPAGPNDVIGRAMIEAGCQVERFLAPVEPGNLLLLGYRDGIPVISAPGCFRSAKPNVLDLLLPPLLARYVVSADEIASLGHGGLLE